MKVLQQIKKGFIFTLLSILDAILLKKSFERIPEPQISEDQTQVNHYDNVMESSMSIIYSLSADIIGCLTKPNEHIEYLDICPGPGRFMQLIDNILSSVNKYALDLSQPMLEKTIKNNPNVITFQDDMTKMDTLKDIEFDLITAMNCLHHLPTKEGLKQAIYKISGKSSSKGIILIVDVLRPKSLKMRKIYTSTFGNIGNPKLIAFQNDFELSMDAGWAKEDFIEFLKEDINKDWISLSNLGFCGNVFYVGVPKGEREKYLNRLQNFKNSKIGAGIVSKEWKFDYMLLKMLFRKFKEV